MVKILLKRKQQQEHLRKVQWASLLDPCHLQIAQNYLFWMFFVYYLTIYLFQKKKNEFEWSRIYMGIAKAAWSSAVTSGSMDLYDGNQWAHKLVVK